MRHPSSLARLHAQIAQRERLARRRRRTRNALLSVVAVVVVAPAVLGLGSLPAVARAVPDLLPTVDGRGALLVVPGFSPAADQLVRRRDTLRDACLSPWYLRALSAPPTHAVLSVRAAGGKGMLEHWRIDCRTLTLVGWDDR